MSNSFRNIAKVLLFTTRSHSPERLSLRCKASQQSSTAPMPLNSTSISSSISPSLSSGYHRQGVFGDVLCSGLSQLSVGTPNKTVGCKICNAHITDSGASFSSLRRHILYSLKLIRPELSPGFLSRQDVHQGDSAVMQTKAFLTAPSNCQQWSQAG